MSILYALESIRIPFLDAVLGVLTYLGDEILFMAIAIAVFWCVSKKWGYYLLTVGFFSTLINQFAKIVCQVPRPWVRDPNFTIVESARAGATGYSFPSGHTASIVGTMGCISRISKKTWVKIAAWAVAAVVAFSRMYLGVHYPSDVLFSLGVGIVLVYGIYPVFAGDADAGRRVYYCVAALTGLSLAFALFTVLHKWAADVDAENLAHAVKNAWTLTGCGAGMLASLYVEQRYVNFDVQAPWWAQILKVVLGLVILIGIKEGVKLGFNAIGFTSLAANCFRYLLMVVFAACVWPMTFPWFAAGCRRAKR